MITIDLDAEQKDTIRKTLAEFQLEEYQRHVELACLGLLSGADFLQLLRVICKSCELRGGVFAVTRMNEALLGAQELWRNKKPGE